MEPPSYTVDERSKVVGGYEPREPNNWGRWGEDDQRGTQNLIGDEEGVRRWYAGACDRRAPVRGGHGVVDPDQPVVNQRLSDHVHTSSIG